MQTCDLLKFALARSNGSSFLLRTQYEMPFINNARVKWQKAQKTEKYTANVQMARTVGVVFGLSVFIFTSLQTRDRTSSIETFSRMSFDTEYTQPTLMDLLTDWQVINQSVFPVSQEREFE